MPSGAGRLHVLGVIPARGGSKGVIKKNIKLLAGQPLLTYTIQAAQRATRLTRLIVSTDDEEVRQVALRCGADVPFLRPAALAQDETPDLPVFQDLLRWLDEHERYRPQVVVHLRPTSPFRAAQDIDRGVTLLLDHPKADAVRSVSPPAQNPFKMWRIEDGVLRPLLTSEAPEPYNTPRQKLPAVYWQNGQVDVTRHDTIMVKQSMTGGLVLPLMTEPTRSIDLDSAADFELAECLLAKQAALIARGA